MKHKKNLIKDQKFCYEPELYSGLPLVNFL